MFISKLLRDGEDFIVEIPAEEIEAHGLSEGDWIDFQVSLPTEAEIAEYLATHPEATELDS